MNIKPEIDSLVNIARHDAESREERRQAQKRLFIFAIEIGRRKKLTPEERSLYEKTFLTAYILSGVAERGAPPSRFDQLADGSLGDWLNIEPKVKAWLERAMGQSFDEADQRRMSQETRQMVAEGLSMLYGDELSEAEISSILERLEHPLDRA
jgi:hypothetical protein